LIILRLVIGLVGAATLGLVLQSIRIGSYPARSSRVSQSVHPIKFWSMMTASILMGLVFLSFACFAQIKSTHPIRNYGKTYLWRVEIFHTKPRVGPRTSTSWKIQPPNGWNGSRGEKGLLRLMDIEDASAPFSRGWTGPAKCVGLAWSSKLWSWSVTPAA